MAKKLSPTQLDTLRHMAAGGYIRRFPGGFWTTDADADKGCSRPGSQSPADWTVEVRTLRSLQRLGFVERVGDYVEEWRDSRRLTVAGRTAVIEANGLPAVVLLTPGGVRRGGGKWDVRTRER